MIRPRTSCTAERSRWRGNTGSALVELAVVLPLLVLIIIGTVDFARVFYTAIELTNAARAGTQYAASLTTRPNDVTGINNVVQGASSNIAPITVTLGTPLPPLCWCTTDTASSFSSAASCASACPAGQHLVQTVTVTVSKTFTFIARLPGFPATMDIQRAATTRVAF
jgi:Flp pilus assembly protein TadG